MQILLPSYSLLFEAFFAMPHLTETTKMELFLLPIPAAGHLTSTMEMASRLLDRVGGGGLSVTVLVMTTPAPCLRFETESCIRSLSSIGAGVRFEELPVLPPAQFFEECDQVGASCSRYVELHKPRLKTAILRLRSSPAAALVIDFFATTMIDVADELGIPAYHYFTSSAATLALLLHAPTLHDKKKHSRSSWTETRRPSSSSPACPRLRPAACRRS